MALLLTGRRVRGHTRDGDADQWPISWENAVKEAGDWLGSLRLGRDLRGQAIDLTEQVKSLPFDGVFRQMVIEAVRRKLVKRGAKEIILPRE